MRAEPDRATCGQVAGLLPAVVDGAAVASPELIAHVEGCLRCQAELAQYRRILRTLRQLRTEVLEPAPGLLTDILAGIEEAGERRAMRSLLSRHRVAYIGGIAAATAAAGATGVIVLVSRARSRRMPLAG